MLLLWLFFSFIECGGVIDVSDGRSHEISSPFFPLSYRKKRKCQWIFHSEEFQHITIQFKSFSVKFNENCQSDKLTIESGESLFTFCGSEKPFPITSVTNRMVVEYETDGLGDFPGFHASVKAADKG